MKFALKTAAAFWLPGAGLLAGTPPKPKEPKDFAEMAGLLTTHVQRGGVVAWLPSERKP